MNTQNIDTCISGKVTEIWDEIHDCIKKSKLHFCIRQTPFSSYITVRRQFQKQFLNESRNVLNSEIKPNEKSIETWNLNNKVKDLESEKK